MTVSTQTTESSWRHVVNYTPQSVITETFVLKFLLECHLCIGRRLLTVLVIGTIQKLLYSILQKDGQRIASTSQSAKLPNRPIKIPTQDKPWISLIFIQVVESSYFISSVLWLSKKEMKYKTPHSVKPDSSWLLVYVANLIVGYCTGSWTIRLIRSHSGPFHAGQSQKR